MEFKEPKIDLEEEKYSNEDYVREVLENGSDDELSRVSEFYNWSDEETERYRHFSRLRRATLDNMAIDWERRLKENPEPTAEELSMGAYWEKIEPQVLEAVRSLRDKGYSTCYSGFGGWGDEQTIKLEAPILPVSQVSALADSFAARGAKLEVSPEEISFTMGKEVFSPELTGLWDEIAAAVPDQGHSAPDCHLGSAESFRKRFNKNQ